MSSKCAPKFKREFTSSKSWHLRTPIVPNLIVLHSTESAPGSGVAVSSYLARPDIEADIHIVADYDGSLYSLVPDDRKAWHVAAYNNRALGIEQVGRAVQSTWPQPQLEAVARQIAFWSYHRHIPIRGTRGGRAGVTMHSRLGMAGGGHHDPGKSYPFRRVLRLARKYKRECYGSVRAYGKGE